MATPVVESTTAVATGSGSVVIAKPAGLAVGDAIIAVLASRQSTNPAWNTATGFTEIELSDDDVAGSIQIKIADSSDVAASDFTFTCVNGSAAAQGAIMRVSDIRSFDTVADSVTQSVTPSGNSLQYNGLALDPNTDNCLIVGVVVSGGSLNHTISGITPLPAVSETELYSIGTGINWGANAFYWIQGVDTEVTDLTATTNNASTDGNALVLVAFRPDHATSGTAAALHVNTQINEPNGIAGVNATVAALHVSPSVNSHSVTINNPTQWTNEAEVNTDWTNENTL